ncbi:NAD(P)(+)--arginine ADP-ribosyltransferase 2-like [Carassius auratus]|uniref:NAD(P)(+)--arginine ADP-ribosyltransferase n=1 Tax=Carassius auratus TaxID=7957 RepID=A0A6P6MGX2_CARAU|nr:NAD(P)(+)--arginine ADP-ribosyltransferase 2-like [Carassius auratus]
MLLIIDALLLISAALGKDHRAATEEEIVPLDMALNSVDDYYEGCREKMTNLVKTEYLGKELCNSAKFKKAWLEATLDASCGTLKCKNTIAIYMYTNTDYKIYEIFNNDGRNGKQNYENKTYKWYSLQFLLTEAIRLLKKQQNRCYSTYRGTKLIFDKDALNKEICFGSFTSSSLDRYSAHRFGAKSCFEINTCEGAEVTNYSRFPYEKEVLIPPYEKFKVTAVKTKGAWCETVFMLKSSGIISYLNCALFKKPTKTITKYYGLL